MKNISLNFVGSFMLVTGLSFIAPMNLAYSESTYQARLYNCDDSCSLYVNGSLVLETGLNDDTGWQSVNFPVRANGENQVTLVVPNKTGGYTYGAQIYNNKGNYVFKRECGVTFKRGCNGNSQETGAFRVRGTF